MGDGAALLAAVRARPDDDTPRLVYADWLDDAGTTPADHARARFIRVQVERARIGDRRRPPLAARAIRLNAEAAELIYQFRDVWLHGLPPAALRLRSDRLFFQRGFLNLVNMPAAEVPAASPGLWEREPVAQVDLDGTAAEIGRAVARPWLRGVGGFGIRLGQGDGGWDDLAALLATGPLGPALGSLRLNHRGFTDAALRALAASTALPSLRDLYVGAGCSAVGWAALVSAPLAGQFESLSLWAWPPFRGEPDRWIGPDGAAVLAAAPRLRALRALHLVSDRLGGEGVRILLESGQLAGLRSLFITNDDLSAPVPGALSPGTGAELEHLCLERCGLTPAAVRWLAAGGLLTRLRHLNLQSNDLPVEAVQALLDGPADRYRVEVLDLGHTGIGDDGATALAAADRFPELRQLRLASTGMTDAGAEALLAAPWADQLERLDIGGNHLSPGMENRFRDRFGAG
ncbi:MAG TPA: TIGR02996 domain-containing protein [Urbifossiella sp.]|nr:TIGR02996 domain-containing protein [Urbifossiella sp.]